MDSLTDEIESILYIAREVMGQSLSPHPNLMEQPADDH